MARGNKQMDGQMCLFDFSTDVSNYVVQANALVNGKQTLKINSGKLIRAAIMQIKAGDEEIKPYLISVSEMAELFQISKSNLYRDIDAITDDIINNPVHVRQESENGVKWVKIPWVSRCEYNSDVGVVIKLNDELKPYLLNLKEQYLQYHYEQISSFKSGYSIRILEMILSRIYGNLLPKDGKHVIIGVEELKECCGCKDEYKEFSNFRARVIDAAQKEINKSTSYVLKYEYIKKGRSVVAIDFFINMCYH